MLNASYSKRLVGASARLSSVPDNQLILKVLEFSPLSAFLISINFLVLILATIHMVSLQSSRKNIMRDGL